jgi:dTDP-4-amino-4,6-dideoxygalactose transaminase
MIDLTKSNLFPSWPIWGEEELKYFQACLQSGNWSRGQATDKFEQVFAEFCGCKYALLVNSGTDALIIALRAIGVEPGDEIIVPGLTWPSTALAVLECGAKAVIVDIEPHTYGISPQSVIEHISPKTKAVIAVHLFNSTADLDALLKITNEAGIFLLEDAAQAHGCCWQNKQVGTFGAIGIFSFQQKKLMTCGEGGCLVTNDESLFAQAYALRDHGALWQGSKVERYAGNSRLSSLCAAVLLAQLKRLPAIVEAEEKAGKYLTEQLNQIPNIVCLERREEITQQTFYNFCLRLLNRELVNRNKIIRQQLSEFLPIQFNSTYPPLDDRSFFKPHLEKRYRGLWKFGNLENCHQAYQEAIRFPHQYLLSCQEDLTNIVENIKAVLSLTK